MTASADKPAATAGAVTVEQLQQAEANARAEGMRAGAEAERVRIAGILTHAESAERRTLAEHLAFKTANTIDEAAALLAVSPKAAAAPANMLASRMANEPQPKVGADVESTGTVNAPRIDAAKVYQLRRAAADAAA